MGRDGKGVFAAKAGQVAAAPGEVFPKAVLFRNVAVRTRDAVALSTDVYLPSQDGVSAAAARFPTVLIRLPYGKEIAQAASHWSPAFWTRHGYAFVIQDCRGTKQSEGAFEPMFREGEDGYDTIAWIGQQPWSDGRVATIGKSYFGGDQVLTAAERPPGLVTAMPHAPALNQFRNSWVYMDGVFDLLTALPWSVQMAPDAIPRMEPGAREKTLADMALLDPPRRLALNLATSDPQFSVEQPTIPASFFRTLPLEDIPVARRTPWWRGWLDHRDRPQYFAANATEGKIEAIQVPMLTIGGWYDMLLRNALEVYAKSATSSGCEAARDGQRLIIDPTAHLPGADCEAPPGADYNLEALHLAWLDQQMNGRRHPFFDHRVVLFVMGENRWRAETAWPLPGTAVTRYYLRSQGAANSAKGDGVLLAEAPGEEPFDSYDYDPHDPAPTVGGSSLTGGRADQGAVEVRSDVLVYSSPALEEDVEVTGPIKATLYASSSATDTDWWVKLVDVSPEGKAMNLISGVVRARYRHSRERPEALIPGDVEKYDIDMWATSNVFRKGHRIRVEVSSSNFPWGERNPNAFVDLNTVTERDFVVARQKIFHDARYPSSIDLPIIPATRARHWIPAPFSEVPIEPMANEAVTELPASQIPH